jgi:archaellin
MPTDIKLKNSVTATNAPTSLQQGEVAINITDKKVWVGNAATTPVLLLGSGADGTFTNLTVSGVASFADGTVSLPSITNIGDTNTGIFFPAADTIAFTEGGVESMRITSDGRLGIGTTSPASTLGLTNTSGEIARFTNTTGGERLHFYVRNSAGTSRIDAQNSDLQLFTTDGNSLILGTTSTERMRIDSSGNVGIGTSSPAATLHVSRSTGSTLMISNTSTSLVTNDVMGNLDFTAGTANTTNARVSGLVVGTSEAGGSLVVETRPDGGSLTERMRITSTGDVGIGTTNPANARLRVNQPSGEFGAAKPLQSWAYANSQVVNLYMDSNVNPTWDTDAESTWNPPATMIWQFRTSERMRLSAGGTLFIGATTSPSGTQRLVLAADGGAGTEPMLINELRTGNATENYVRFYRNGSQVGSIQNNSTSTIYNTTSDYRLKENVAPMTGALAKVQALKPCTYTWKLNGSTGQGFIAHELQAVVPECVTGEKDALNKQGNPEYQGIDTSFLVATLTAAIQELKAEFDAYKATHP